MILLFNINTQVLAISVGTGTMMADMLFVNGNVDLLEQDSLKRLHITQLCIKL